MESILTIEDMVAASDFMSTLGGQEAKPKPVLSPDSETVTNRTQELAIASGTSEEEVRASEEAGDDVYNTQAKVTSNKGTPTDIIDLGRELGFEPTEVITLINNRDEKVRALPADQYLLAQSMLAEDGSYYTSSSKYFV